MAAKLRRQRARAVGRAARCASPARPSGLGRAAEVGGAPRRYGRPVRSRWSERRQAQADAVLAVALALVAAVEALTTATPTGPRRRDAHRRPRGRRRGVAGHRGARAVPAPQRAGRDVVIVTASLAAPDGRVRLLGGLRRPGPDARRGVLDRRAPRAAGGRRRPGVVHRLLGGLRAARSAEPRRRQRGRLLAGVPAGRHRVAGWRLSAHAPPVRRRARRERRAARPGRGDRGAGADRARAARRRRARDERDRASRPRRPTRCSTRDPDGARARSTRSSATGARRSAEMRRLLGVLRAGRAAARSRRSPALRRCDALVEQRARAPGCRSRSTVDGEPRALPPASTSRPTGSSRRR